MHLPLLTDDRETVPCASGLYVVATPIGNLKDITLRALETLDGVDLIAAEDTRHTVRLLSHYQINTPLISCHEHNEHQRTPELIEKIRSGAAVALVSDAGTPSVSDPGYRLIRTAVQKGLNVYPIPGVSAAITALSASGLPMDTFLFVGFAPKKRGKRQELLKSLAHEGRTLVFFESPRRVHPFLDELGELMGDRPIVVAREMTKIHEEFLRGTISEVSRVLAERQQVKGECTLLIGGASEKRIPTEAEVEAAVRTELCRPGTRISSVSRELAKTFGLPRKKVYELALKVDRDLRNKSNA
jgi:16S rRNA (cytidine1402-2'-O)-methyltransferase